MALNYFTNVSNVTAGGDGDDITEVKQVGYTINDDPRTDKLDSVYNRCVAAGDRTREMTVISTQLIELWTAFIAAGYGACSFDLSGENCSDGTTDTATFGVGNGTGSSFSFTADGKETIEGEATFALVGDPS